MDLIEFLKARLDEDEQGAHAAIRGGNPAVGELGQWSAYLEGGDDGWAVEDDAAGIAPGVVGDERVAAHVARHDPARVLREVETKRQLLHAHARDHECISLLDQGEHSVVDDRPWEYWEAKDTAEHGPCLVVRLIALPYSDHPDYREERKP